MQESRSASRSEALRLAAISFLVLFFELVCIRWTPAYVRLLSFFSNFVLLAAFLGIGLGCMFARRRWSLVEAFPALCFCFVSLVTLARFEIDVESQARIYFTAAAETGRVRLGSIYLLPLLYVIIAGLFAMLAQEMGRAMDRFRPITAYSLNVAGSLAGIAAFSAVAFLRLPPVVWFGLSFLVLLPFLGRGRRWRAMNLVLLAGSLVIVGVLGWGKLWSPYYKISVEPLRGYPGTMISVNDISHQVMLDVEKQALFYDFPYQFFPRGAEEILIIGAGSGTDTAAALQTPVKHVDAVEIDPLIVKLGRELHPNRPYADPRVTVHVNDARSFLQRTSKRYDLILFALIDSLTLQSSYSSIRLENYVFTEECFRDVRRHLQPDGMVVIYNFFREPWLVGKIAGMLARVFEQEPRVLMFQKESSLAVLMAGGRAARMREDAIPPERRFCWIRGIAGATDDWPFLYMRERTLPGHYLQVMAIVLGISLLAVALSLPRGGRRISWHFFFLGAAFLLLETRSITRFALLFGTTWFVNSLVFFAILVAILLANLYVLRRRVTRLRPYYLVPVRKCGSGGKGDVLWNHDLLT
jgi:spermidine synthase